MSDIFEKVKLHLPPYLSPEKKEQLYQELKSFPEKFSYYIFKDEPDVLQGDGWSGFEIISLETKEVKKIKAIVLSNTCDIDPNNKRVTPPKIIIAPLIALEKFIQVLENEQIPEIEIKEKVKAIKRQEITSIFYLPANEKLEKDHVVLLDDLYSQLFNSFAQSDRKKLFTLSQSGFYLFLLKLSIHFCRFNDGVIR
jgi:hypothetical protein